MLNPIKVILPVMIIFTLIFSSCGRNKETTESKENATIDLTTLAPRNVENADNGNWEIKQKM